MEYNTKLEMKAVVSILKLLWQLLLGNFKLYTLQVKVVLPVTKFEILLFKSKCTWEGVVSYFLPHSWLVSFSTDNFLGLKRALNTFLPIIDWHWNLKVKRGIESEEIEASTILLFFFGGVSYMWANKISFETCCSVCKFCFEHLC